MKKKNLAIGAAVAAAVGYVAGILTAPKSGKETRKDIKDAAVKTKTEAEKNLKKLHSEISDLIEEAQKKAKSLKDKAQKDIHEAIEHAQAAKDKAREVLSVLHEGDTDDKDLQKAVDEVKKAKEHLKKYLSKEHGTANKKA